MTKIFRTATIPLSLNILLKGQLKYLSKEFNITAISGEGSELDEILKREGVKIEAVKMRREISLFQDLYSLANLYILFRREKPSVVHSITPKSGLLSMVAAKLARVPVRIHTFTGLIFPSKSGFMNQLLIVMDKVLCRCATNIYPEGNGVRKDLIKYKITNKPLKVIANGNVNGVDLDYFDPNQITLSQRNHLRRELDIKLEDFVFIFIGRLVKDKGIDELVSAFKNLPSENVKLLLVGPFESQLDPLRKETLKEIKQNPRIIAVGFQEDVRPYFGIANALSFPSYREGFPNVVMQAGAMDLPSIVTDISGCNEIIENGVNGIIIPSKNISKLQSAMERLVENKGEYKKLRDNSRPMIASRYEQIKVWDALVAEYKLLLNT